MTKQVIVVRKDLNMRKGKIAAQVAHASLGVFTRMLEIRGLMEQGKYMGVFPINEIEKEWFENSFTKICASCDSEDEIYELEMKANAAGLPYKLIIDNGQTEFNGVPTVTCLAVGPARAEEIDKITGHLKLL